MFKVGEKVILDGEEKVVIAKIDKKGNIFIDGLKSVKFDQSGKQVGHIGTRQISHKIEKIAKKKKNEALERKKSDLASKIVSIMVTAEGVQHTETYMNSALTFHVGAIDALETEVDVDKYLATYVPGSNIKKDILDFVIKNTAVKNKEREEMLVNG